MGPLLWMLAQYFSLYAMWRACSGPQGQDTSVHGSESPLDRWLNSAGLWAFLFSPFKRTACFCGPILPLGQEAALGCIFLAKRLSFSLGETSAVSYFPGQRKFL